MTKISPPEDELYEDAEFQNKLWEAAFAARRRYEDLREQMITASWAYSDAQKRAECKHHAFYKTSDNRKPMCRFCGAEWDSD